MIKNHIISYMIHVNIKRIKVIKKKTKLHCFSSLAFKSEFKYSSLFVLEVSEWALFLRPMSMDLSWAQLAHVMGLINHTNTKTSFINVIVK